MLENHCFIRLVRRSVSQLVHGWAALGSCVFSTPEAEKKKSHKKKEGRKKEGLRRLGEQDDKDEDKKEGKKYGGKKKEKKVELLQELEQVTPPTYVAT